MVHEQLFARRAERAQVGIVSVAAAKILRRHQHRDVITLVVVEREGQRIERRVGEEEVLEVLVLEAPPTSLYRFTATVSLISQPTCAGSRLGREFSKAFTGVFVIYPLGPLCQLINRLRSIVSGDLPRAAVLFVWLPLIALSYFGTLTIAAWFSPQAYNWRGSAISKLLYPGYDPRLHYVASLGVAVTGLLIVPLAGYIRQRLRRVSAMAADAGAFALELGAIGLVLAGLIVSHPAHGTSAFPRLHEILARTAAFDLGAGIIVFWLCAAKGYLAAAARSLEWRRLLISWSLIALPALSIALLRAAVGAHIDWSKPIYRKLEDRALWHLAFWEWLGSAAMFLFLLTAVLYLPESDSQR